MENHVLNVNKKIALTNYAFEIFPAFLFTSEIDLLMLVEVFPETSVNFLKKRFNADFQKDEFSFSKHAFIFKKGNPYYVIVCHFPFEEDDDHVELVKDIYIVGHPSLKDIYVYVDVLRKSASGYFYEMLRVWREDEFLHYTSIMNHVQVSETENAQQCCVWTVLLDKEEDFVEKND